MKLWLWLRALNSSGVCSWASMRDQGSALPSSMSGVVSSMSRRRRLNRRPAAGLASSIRPCALTISMATGAAPTTLRSSCSLSRRAA
ncbi:hypothetical protein D3C77_439440 [compost metagenome]